MTPDWYDLLGVPRDADTDTIRAAWKAATANLDPTDRTFRVYSQAAEVLLDDQRRAAYDAQLAAEEPAVGEPAVGEPAVGEPEEPVVEESAVAESVVAEGSEPTAARGRRVPGWLLLGTGLLTALALVAATILHLTAPEDPSVREVLGEVAWWDDESVSGNLAVPRQAEGALEAAEAAIGPLTAYDHRRLDESRDAALEVITPEFAEDYTKLYEGAVRDNALETQTVVTVTGVRASAVGRVGDGYADVLVFFDRQVTNKALSTPRAFEDQATLRMKRVDGRWLVDDVRTTPAGG